MKWLGFPSGLRAGGGVASFAFVSAVACSSVSASSLTASSVQGGTAEDPTTVTTITITPGQGEQIRDVHLYPTSPNKKLPPGGALGLPDGWSSSGSGSSENGLHVKAAQATSSPLPASPATTITITVSGAPNTQSWSNFHWTTSSNASSGKPNQGGSGYVDHDVTTSDGPNYGGMIPVAALRLAGPATVAIGETGTFLADAAVLEQATLTYTVYAASSLDPYDSGRVDVADPVPASWDLELSTNSRTGTTAVGTGVVSATYYGDAQNHVLLSIPYRPDLIGETIYLQVDFSDGESTPPVAVTIGS